MDESHLREGIRRQANAVFKQHPLPWTLVGLMAYDDTGAVDETFSSIVDANGATVIASSEWLHADVKTLTLIVATANFSRLLLEDEN